MRVVALLLLLVPALARAQPADSTADRRAISSLSLGPLGLSASPDHGTLLLSAVRYTRSLGAGPLVVEVGATDNLYLSPFGSGSTLREVHVAAGAAVSGGPLLVSVVAGPSVGWTRRPSALDPAYADGRARVVPGALAGVRAVFVVVPAIGIGVEGVAHVNAEVPAAGVGLTLAFGRLPGALVPNPPPRPRRPPP